MPWPTTGTAAIALCLAACGAPTAPPVARAVPDRPPAVEEADGVDPIGSAFDAEARHHVVSIAHMGGDRLERTPDADALRAYVAAHGQALRAEYAETQDEFLAAELRLRIHHIVVAVARETSAEDRAAARARVDRMRERIEAGESFEEMARSESDDAAHRPRGGDLGFLSGSSAYVPEEAFDALRAAPLGDVRGPFESEFGFHIFRAVARRQGDTPLAQALLDLAEPHVVREKALAAAMVLAREALDQLQGGSPLERAVEDAVRGSNFPSLDQYQPADRHFYPSAPGSVPSWLGAVAEWLSTPRAVNEAAVLESSYGAFVVVSRRTVEGDHAALTDEVRSCIAARLETPDGCEHITREAPCAPCVPELRQLMPNWAETRRRLEALQEQGLFEGPGEARSAD
ncbi:MAG: peptidylprolyl isomerase [Sandaracinaceae bacterium]